MVAVLLAMWKVAVSVAMGLLAVLRLAPLLRVLLLQKKAIEYASNHQRRGVGALEA